MTQTTDLRIEQFDRRIVIINRNISSINNTAAINSIHKGEWFIAEDTKILYRSNPVTGEIEKITGKRSIEYEVSSIFNTIEVKSVPRGMLFTTKDTNITYLKTDDSVYSQLTNNTNSLAVKTETTGNVILDTAIANYFYCTPTSEITLKPINMIMDVDNVTSFVLDIKGGGKFPVKWWSNLNWDRGVAPSLSKEHSTILGFYGVRKQQSSNIVWHGLMLSAESN